MDNILADIKTQMEDVLSLSGDDINSVRVGRAKPALVEKVKVSAYGSRMEVRELGSISAPDPQSLVVKPWDKTVLEAVQKAIFEASLGLNPVVDGDLIRINIPPLTTEQREELSKLIDQKAESARVMVRQVRTSGKDKIESQKGEAGVSEDDIHNTLKELQELTDDYIAKLNELAEDRKKEVTTL